MANRKNLGIGRGKGFKNIIPNQDRRTHSNSARGIKQPQRIRGEAMIDRFAFENKPLIERYLDIVSFNSSEDFKKILKQNNLPLKVEKLAVNNKNLFMWTNDYLTIITTNNPITGENMNPAFKNLNKGYAGNVRVFGKVKDVNRLINSIRQESESFDTEFRREVL